MGRSWVAEVDLGNQLKSSSVTDENFSVTHNLAKKALHTQEISIAADYIGGFQLAMF